jgi:hypothetical protein
VKEWKIKAVTAKEAGLFDEKEIEKMYYIRVKKVSKKD